MDFEYHINRHREQVSKGLKLARNVLVIVLIALFLEVFLFNINQLSLKRLRDDLARR